VFRFKAAIEKTALTEFASYKIFDSEVPSSTLDQCHHLLIKLSWQSTSKYIDAYKCTICSILFAANIAVQQEVIMAVISIA